MITKRSSVASTHIYATAFSFNSSAKNNTFIQGHTSFPSCSVWGFDVWSVTKTASSTLLVSGVGCTSITHNLSLPEGNLPGSSIRFCDYTLRVWREGQELPLAARDAARGISSPYKALQEAVPEVCPCLYPLKTHTSGWKWTHSNF